MRTAIIYCSKSGNTAKVAQAIASGIIGEVDLIHVNLTPEGIMLDWQDSFTFDLAPYDLIFFGGWATLMKIHPYLVAYIKRCKYIENKKVYGFITAAAIFSIGHTRDNLTQVLNARNIHMSDCFSVTTLLGLTLTMRKLAKARAFGRKVSLEVKKLVEKKDNIINWREEHGSILANLRQTKPNPQSI